MSSTDNTTREWREETSSERRGALGMIRRMAARLTEGAFWQIVGHLLLDNRTPETRDAEVFGTLGFYSRPKAGANAEVMVVFPGGSANPVIVGTRDEELRATIANLAQGETAMCNRAVIVICKSNGTVEIRLPGGTALPLPKLAELADVVSKFNSHTHVVSGVTAGGAAVTSAVPVPLATAPSGTAVLKAQ